MSEVSSTVNFLVGNPQDLIDDRKPEVTIQYGGLCQVQQQLFVTKIRSRTFIDVVKNAFYPRRTSASIGR